MAEVHGQKSDVFFGDAEKPLPDWRKEPQNDSDDDTLTADERKALIGMLGFDPRAVAVDTPTDPSDANL